MDAAAGRNGGRMLEVSDGGKFEGRAKLHCPVFDCFRMVDETDFAPARERLLCSASVYAFWMRRRPLPVIGEYCKKREASFAVSFLRRICVREIFIATTVESHILAALIGAEKEDVPDIGMRVDKDTEKPLRRPGWRISDGCWTRELCSKRFCRY